MADKNKRQTMTKQKAKAMRGEVPLQEFIHSEAARTHVSPYKVRRRVWLGHYPRVRVRFVNRRVAFAKVTGKLPDLPQDLRAWRYGKPSGGKK
jgi:hypothetical protein